MRNLKKILALALVFAMAFTFTAGAAVDFTDAASINADYADDVNMLVELGVIAGYPDGSFGPEKNITRAEFAKMAYTIIYGSDTDGNLFAAQKSSFWDVEGNASVAWAKGYINYCANQKIVSGVGGGKFNPQGNITVAEASKMLLVILGCDPAKEGFTGANWMSNVVAKAMELGVYDGWQGDPSALATRELVAKLMANTILSSTYTYSAITGIGSQKNALGTAPNETLGEKTMGLKTVTGIVVANERYALATDAKGNVLTAGSYNGDAIATTAEDEAMILFERKENDGSTSLNTMTIDRALSDEMLGNKVNVFFKADKREDQSSGVISYVNIKVIGDVIVNNDTVAYTVPAVAVDMYPNGEGSSVKVQPYIGFTTADGEVKIVAKSDATTTVGKVAKDVDIMGDGELANVQAVLNKFVYDFQGAADANLVHSSDTTYGTAAIANFYNNMGLDASNYALADATSYRFVSVDGGKTYSYMFKLNSGAGIDFEAVTAYNEARGTIKVTGYAAFDIEDCVIEEGIAVDDFVVVYNANGKKVIEKVDVITGSVEALGDDKSVTIGGNKYYAWEGLDDLNSQTITNFYSQNPAYISANLTYYTYGNLILDINTDVDVAATVDNYAVILGSYTERGSAYVKLGFADGTAASYEVSKLYQEDSTQPSAGMPSVRNDVVADFANGAMIGRVVTYKVLDNGTLDLSGQFLGETTASKKNFDSVAAPVISEGKYGTTYALNDASLVFVVYGTVTNAGTINEVNSLKVKSYKLSDIEAMTGNTTLFNGSVVYNKASNQANKYVVAASIYAGSTLSGITFDETKNWSYIVSANMKYNYIDRAYSVDFVLIDKDGVKNISTIEDVTDFNSTKFSDFSGLTESTKLDGKGTNPAWNGGFVTYETNADGLISMMTVVRNAKQTGASGAAIATALNKDLQSNLPSMINNTKAYDGFYLINIVGERNGYINFYDVVDDVQLKDDATLGYTAEAVDSIKFHEDGYNIIGITEGEYDGEKLYAVSGQTKYLNVDGNTTDVGGATVEKDGANAIVEIYEGKVKTVYSFSDPVSVQ